MSEHQENQQSERKGNLRDEYLRRVCGIANLECGRLVFGKDDEGKKKFVRKAVDL